MADGVVDNAFEWGGSLLRVAGAPVTKKNGASKRRKKNQKIIDIYWEMWCHISRSSIGRVGYENGKKGKTFGRSDRA